MAAVFLLWFILASSISMANPNPAAATAPDPIARAITVDPSGHGDFVSVQQAIVSVPKHNNAWIRIHVKAGIYNEKVVIPSDKPYIFLDGEGRSATVIQMGDHGDPTGSTTFQLLADNFVAKGITFKNTYEGNIVPGGERDDITWTPAARIDSDKASFYECGFIGIQDTLTDLRGRHYFESCYIQGAIDFIWGSGQSIYQKCVINATGSILNGTKSYITAQGRDHMEETSGFVFKLCDIIGTGAMYLGRAYRKHSRVVFYKSSMSNIIVPQGWWSWTYAGQEDTIVYSEVECIGLGSNKSGRVKWLKDLAPDMLHRLIDVASFINREGWMEKQPKLSNY